MSNSQKSTLSNAKQVLPRLNGCTGECEFSPSHSLSYTLLASDARAGEGGAKPVYVMRERVSNTSNCRRRHLPAAQRSGAGGPKTAANLLRFAHYILFPSVVVSLCRVVCTNKLHRSWHTCRRRRKSRSLG